MLNVLNFRSFKKLGRLHSSNAHATQLLPYTTLDTYFVFTIEKQVHLFRVYYSRSINFENSERNASQGKKGWTFLLMHLGIKVCGSCNTSTTIYYLLFLLFSSLPRLRWSCVLCLQSVVEMLAAAQTRSYRMVYSLPMLDMLRRLPIMSHPLKIIHFFQSISRLLLLLYSLQTEKWSKAIKMSRK